HRRRDERPAAPNGSNAAFGPVQSRPADLCRAEARRYRAVVRKTMIGLLTFVLALGLSTAALAQPASPLDGTWRGTSDGGSCNAPLDYVLTIEAGLVDGSSFDTTARGPQPNLKKAPPPAPSAGLWQVYGVAKANSFSLTAVASTQGAKRQS